MQGFRNSAFKMKKPFNIDIMKKEITKCLSLLLMVFLGYSCSSDEVEIPEEEPVYPIIYEEDNIEFEDAKVKEICVANWDTGHDGELSYWEAAHVRSLGDVFKGNREITSFKELKHFIFLMDDIKSSFDDCTNLQSLEIPIRVKIVSLHGLSSLKELVLPEELESLSISSSPLLQPFQLPDSLKSFQIKGSPLITSLHISSTNMEYIDIVNMQGLTELEIDVELNQAVLEYNENLTNIRFNNKVKDLYIARMNTLKEVTFDNEIDMVVFEKNPQLQQMHFNAPIRALGFANLSSLETFDYVEITQSLQLINLEKLHTIHSNALNPSSKLTIVDCSQIKHIIVPKGSADAYNSNEYWSKYASLLQESEK